MTEAIRTYKYVEQGRDDGGYLLEYKLGEEKRDLLVPAIDFETKLDQERYFADQFKIGLPVVAYRAGPIGMCMFKVNPVIVEAGTIVKTVTSHDDDPLKPTTQQITLEPSEFFESHAVDRGYPDSPEHADITAKTITGQPFTATVAFVPR